MTAAQTMVDAIEQAASGRVLVFGSVPPGGRDLDLLVPDAEIDSLADALARVGAHRRGATWALFAPGGAYAVDLVPASSWGLPAAELDALYAAAEPVEGHASLVRPSAAHTLLVLARIGVTQKREQRLREALAVPGARDEAERRAAAWGVELESLERRRGRGRPALGPPKVVALSGLDGSGKSTQARALAEALEAAGLDVHIEWAPILQNRSVELLSSFARVALRAVRRGKPVAEGESLVANVETASAKQRAVRTFWTAVVAGVNGTTHRRASLEHRGRETVVIYDRFVLDSVVRMRFLYGRDEDLTVPRRIVKALSPRAAAAFWLDVPAERAYARKPEHWDVADLTAQRELYAEEHERLGVTRLDGERPPAELSAEIAAEVWRRL